MLGAYNRPRTEAVDSMERVFKSFPRLKERLGQTAGTLSGGELQMLAMGRGLMARPKLLMLDEPSMGLSPILVREIFDIIREINRKGRQYCWWSRMRSWPCRSRTGPMCWRPARWCSSARPLSCCATRKSRQHTSGNDVGE